MAAVMNLNYTQVITKITTRQYSVSAYSRDGVVRTSSPATFRNKNHTIVSNLHKIVYKRFMGTVAAATEAYFINPKYSASQIASLSTLISFWANIVPARVNRENQDMSSYTVHNSCIFNLGSITRPFKSPRLVLGQSQTGNTLKELQLSPWPLLLSIFLCNGALIFIGLMSGVHYSTTWVNISIFFVFFSILNWLLDLSREGTFLGNHIADVRSSLYNGLTLFIVSEIMFFFSLFWTFFNSVLSGSVWVGCAWPPTGLSSYLQTAGLELAIVNTCILLFSGYTLTLSHEFYIRKNKFLSIYFLQFTIGLGFFFMFVQVIEFVNALFSFNDAVYSSTFFFLTGFHGFHVFLGVLALLISWYRSVLDYTRSDQHLGFEAAIWYWHFVDVVWLFVFSLIYVWGNSSTAVNVGSGALYYYNVTNRVVFAFGLLFASLFILFYPRFVVAFSGCCSSSSNRKPASSFLFATWSTASTADVPAFDPCLQLKLQDSATLVAFASKHFFLSMYILTLFIVFFVLFITLMFVYAHEEAASQKKLVDAPQKTHNTFLESIWTTLPSGTISFLAASSFILLFISDVGNSFRFYGDLISNKFPAILRTKVTGSQWFWTYNYDLPKFNELSDSSSKTAHALEQVMRSISSLLPGEHRLLSTGDNLVLPTFTLLRFYITSTDVIHSFALPSMYIKLDACPGRLNLLSTVVTRSGAFYGQCSEICGVNHSFMPISTEVIDSKDFWSGFLNYITEQFAYFLGEVYQINSETAVNTVSTVLPETAGILDGSAKSDFNTLRSEAKANFFFFTYLVFQKLPRSGKNRLLMRENGFFSWIPPLIDFLFDILTTYHPALLSIDQVIEQLVPSSLESPAASELDIQSVVSFFNQLPTSVYVAEQTRLAEYWQNFSNIESLRHTVLHQSPNEFFFGVPTDFYPALEIINPEGWCKILQRDVLNSILDQPDVILRNHRVFYSIPNNYLCVDTFIHEETGTLFKKFKLFFPNDFDPKTAQEAEELTQRYFGSRDLAAKVHAYSLWKICLLDEAFALQIPVQDLDIDSSCVRAHVMGEMEVSIYSDIYLKDPRYLNLRPSTGSLAQPDGIICSFILPAETPTISTSARIVLGEPTTLQDLLPPQRSLFKLQL